MGRRYRPQGGYGVGLGELIELRRQIRAQGRGLMDGFAVEGKGVGIRV